MLCKVAQEGQVIVKSSDKTWSTGGGNGKPLQDTCCENAMNSMKRQKYMTLEDKLPRSEGVQYATGEEWRAIKIDPERMKQLGHSAVDVSAVDVSGVESKV